MTRTPLHLFLNIGTKEHPVFKENSGTGFHGINVGTANGELQFVDIDGDGDLDFFASDAVDYYGQAYIYYFENVGTPKNPSFVSSENSPIPPVNSPFLQPFAFADVDGDGDYDFYTADAGFYTGHAYHQRVYFNKGTLQQPVFNDYVFNQTDDEYDYRTYYDWNKDGLLDYFDVDNYSSYAFYYKNIGPKLKPNYVLDYTDGPKFKNGVPYRIVDLNNDGSPEGFDFNAHYSTLAPIAVIQDTIMNNGGKQITVLSSKNRSANYTYRWDYNGKTIASAKPAYIQATKAGVYTLYVIDDCGTGVSLDYVMNNKNSADMMTNNGNSFLPEIVTIAKAFPNPFTSEITVQLPLAKTTTNSIVKVTDVSGKIWLMQTTAASSITIGKTLPAGTYLLQVFQENKMVYNTTILKQ